MSARAAEFVRLCRSKGILVAPASRFFLTTQIPDDDSDIEECYRTVKQQEVINYLRKPRLTFGRKAVRGWNGREIAEGAGFICSIIHQPSGQVMGRTEGMTVDIAASLAFEMLSSPGEWLKGRADEREQLSDLWRDTRILQANDESTNKQVRMLYALIGEDRAALGLPTVAESYEAWKQRTDAVE